MTDQSKFGPADSGQQFVDEYLANRERLIAAGAYDPADEHDACGVGFVAAIDGKPRRDVVVAGINALKAVWHRGAVDADGKTGDGAGIQVQIPQDFFREQIEKTGHEVLDGSIAVGMVFLPRTDYENQERCRCLVEGQILGFGYSIYGWRQVPIDTEVIGEKANTTRPEIEQIIVANTRDVSDQEFERDLYVIRRRIERAVSAEAINDFYICSLSAHSIVYKGMFLAEQLSAFYPDLLDERFQSTFAIYHQRYSTNTFPTWHLAQPFRMLAHNGEINTLKGNVNWTRAHEPRMASEQFGDYLDDVLPVIQPGSSDSAALDNMFELLCRAGRSAPMSKALLIPQALSADKSTTDGNRALISYSNSVMEPWDGPAAIAASDGRWVVGGMDRNGLRPMRYTLTRDNLLVAGSESGMVRVDEADVLEKGRLGPGEIIAVDLQEGCLYRDAEMKQLLADSKPFGEWVTRVKQIDSIVRDRPATGQTLDKAELRRRQVAVGVTMEDMELILHPMVDQAKEAIGSMGDDTPLAVLSDGYRGLAPLLPAELLPGHQPADRFPTRAAGHEPADAARQPGQRARGRRDPMRFAAARQPDPDHGGTRGHGRPYGRYRRGNRLYVPGRWPVA